MENNVDEHPIMKAVDLVSSSLTDDTKTLLQKRFKFRNFDEWIRERGYLLLTRQENNN